MRVKTIGVDLRFRTLEYLPLDLQGFNSGFYYALGPAYNFLDQDLLGEQDRERGLIVHYDESMSKVVSSDWSLVSTVLGQMTYPVASLTPDSARSYVMQGAPFTQGTIPSIPIGGSISPEGFLSSILLLVVIIVTVLIIAVILVVVVIMIVGVVIVVVFIGIVVVVGGVSSIFKHSFVIIGVLRRIVFYYLLH
ncbi:hypothetical protein Tco_0985859, partial [Tanacetum coccineum]